jgi:hypothetical protein
MILLETAVVRTILWIGYLLLPFMSLPVLPSDYRPVSVLAFAVTGLLALGTRLRRRKIPADEALLLAFLALSALQAAVLVGVLHHEYLRALRHVAVLALGILSYVSLKAFFRIYGPAYSLRLMSYVYFFILALGAVEVLCILRVLPWDLKVFLGTVLGGRTVGRVQLVTSEASWGAKVLLFGVPILAYQAWRYRSRGYLLAVIVSLALLVFTFSLDGLLAAVVAVIVFALFQYKTLLARPKIWLACGLVLAGLGTAFLLADRVLPKRGEYYRARFRILKTGNCEQIRQLPRKDASVFIRLYYPWIGVRMFLAKPYGVGLGGYGLYFKGFLDSLGVNYSRFPEVMGDVRTRSGDPKSLYAKILAENGLFSGWVFVLYIILHGYYLKNAAAKEIIPYRNLVLALLAVNLGILFQFGSYAYLPMWFAFALNAQLHEGQERPAESPVPLEKGPE